MAAYVELHSHSYYSLLDGASSPEDLIQQAAHLNMTAMALTDHDAVYGVIPFIEAAKAVGIKPILGAEMTLTDGNHLTLLVENERGWHNLCHLITVARQNAPKGQAELPLNALTAHTEGLLALSGCRKGEIPAALLKKRAKAALDAAARYREWFGRDKFWIELQHHFLPDDDSLNAALVSLAHKLKLGYVATNNVHYARPDRHRLQDVLVCIRHNTTLDQSHHLRRPTSEYYLKSADEMAALFSQYPEALANTLHIANQCVFDLTYGLQDLPTFPTPNQIATECYLRQLCQEVLSDRYPQQPRQVINLLDHELDLIGRSGLANYFLIVWDLVRFAREQGIRCQGRGSAANSLVAYLLGISPIDPLQHDLVFERFLSDERPAVPDIDIDFAADRREEVIQYVYQRYGREHTAMACTFITFRSRSALRDVGKAIGLPIAVIEQAALAADRGDPLPVKSTMGQQLTELVDQIDGFPRHLGIHNGGMVITGAPLSQRLPSEPASMSERFVVQWDKDMLETAGMVKIDLLGLRMLSAISEALDWVEHITGQQPNLSQLTFDDSALFEQITEADTIGVFQVESRAQAQVLPRLRPKTFTDLIVCISLIRPGPIQGNMVHPYLRRRSGQEAIIYPHPLLKPALSDTLGVILWQEQVLKVARDLAGFTPGQGELLRRTLGNKRADEAIGRFEQAFIDGAMHKGVEETVAQTVFEMLRAFGGYSFPKSHAAAFAVLVYQSAWLKHYAPAAFFVALLNNQPMGYWSPSVIIHDAKRHGLHIQGIDLCSSEACCTTTGQDIQLGFNYVKGISTAAVEKLMLARSQQPFTDLTDFCRRTRLPQSTVENLILAGAMDFWDQPRRSLLWELGKLRHLSDSLQMELPDETVNLPTLSEAETLAHEHAVLGLSTGDHVMALYRKELKRRAMLDSHDLSTRTGGTPVVVAGLIVMHQAPPTAKGFHFLTLEDEQGFINVIIRPRVYARFRRVIRSSALIVVEGQVQREGAVINVLCDRVQPLPG